MARLFDDGSNEYLVNANAALSAFPLSFSAWVYPDDTAIMTIMGIFDSGAGDFARLLLHTSGTAVRLQVSGGSGANTSTSWTQDAWNHCAGVLNGSGAGDLTVYLDGGGADTDNGGGSTPGNWDSTEVGVLNNGGARSQYMSGRIGEAGLWNASLTAAEVAILAAGYSPLFVRPQSLVAYWPLIRDEDQDRVGGFDMTPTNGPTVADHPPIIYPAPPVFFSQAAAAAPAGNPWYSYAQQ